MLKRNIESWEIMHMVERKNYKDLMSLNHNIRIWEGFKGAQ